MSDLANYSIRIAIDGMKVPGKPEGVGDRELVFSMPLDPTDVETATEIWYGHLRALLGENPQANLQALAKQLED